MERPAGQWGIRKRGTRSRQTLGRRADRVRESGFVAFIVSHENFLLRESQCNFWPYWFIGN